MQTSTRVLSFLNVRARRAGAFLVVAGLASAPLVSGCAKVQDDNSSSYLIISSINAASGASPNSLGGVLFSDVLTNGGLFNDPGQVKFQLGMKNATLTPTSANFITVNRYRVEFAPTVAGAAVPPAFESSFTVTVTGTDAQGGFVLVPTSLKEIAPLTGLVSAGELHTIATITFFGKDQAGRDVQVTGTIGVHFANWADPQ